MLKEYIEAIKTFSEQNIPFTIKGAPVELWYIVWIFIFGGVVLGGAMLFAGLASFAERRFAGFFQCRLGPNRVGPEGFFQFIADGIKLVLKEDLIPAAADKMLFRAAPYVVFIGTLGVFAALPFSKSLGITNLNLGLLYIFAISSLVIVGIIMAGWGSGNKWSLLGGMRSAAQIISYEIPIGVVFLTMIMITSTMNMQEIVNQQGGGLVNWLVFRYPPFTLFAFLIYFIAAMAEVNRTPFDLPEAESELVGGFHTEYSGMRFAFFFMAEYANMFVVSAIATVLFLGGWQSPLPFFILNIFGDYSILAIIEGFGWFITKVLFLVFLMMWLRWTLPRYRVDQLMAVCWKVLLPLSFANLLLIGIWMIL
ncbi:MAG: NADH-quinone oxidoreductase subunit NuoH [Planctomycetota bacterium]|nr:NADH-quinone oxidoreductase subunit NuoH [Planctomycetota bacterium]MDI6788368.1 NADH-quinone oxidoreductase subunit NuoH [Planctomycetota bacterium]